MWLIEASGGERCRSDREMPRRDRGARGARSRGGVSAVSRNGRDVPPAAIHDRGSSSEPARMGRQAGPPSIGERQEQAARVVAIPLWTIGVGRLAVVQGLEVMEAKSAIA